MVDEQAILIRAFDRFQQVQVHGPDVGGRVTADLGLQGMLDLGMAETPAAQAALVWRSRRRAAWLDQAPAYDEIRLCSRPA